jgi:hypothetical protein
VQFHDGPGNAFARSIFECTVPGGTGNRSHDRRGKQHSRQAKNAKAISGA